MGTFSYVALVGLGVAVIVVLTCVGVVASFAERRPRHAHGGDGSGGGAGGARCGGGSSCGGGGGCGGGCGGG